MKILIITTVRTGGSYLFESLALRYKIRTTYFEPDFFPEVSNKIITKVHATVVDTEKLIEYSKQYDHTVILDRRNKLDQAKSFSMLMSGKVASSKSEYTAISYDDKDVETKLIELTKVGEILKYIGNRLNQDIYYYEDIYYGGKSLNGLEFYPDTNKRLLKPLSKTLI